jgi:plastocyanin
MSKLHLLIALPVLAVTDGFAAPRNGAVTGDVAVIAKDGAKRHEPVVVYLDDVPGAPAETHAHAIIKQREKQFEPPLTVVVKGTTIDFPNEDKIFHNVFSVSRPSRFDLGLYKSGSSKSVEMKRAGTVDVYCNIHPDMIAKVKILENGYYSITDAAGHFAIEGVPPGRYPITAWLASGDEAHGTVEVKAGDAAKIELEVKAVTGQAAHTRKDGTPYGRYK